MRADADKFIHGESPRKDIAMLMLDTTCNSCGWVLRVHFVENTTRGMVLVCPKLDHPNPPTIRVPDLTYQTHRKVVQ